MRIDCLHGYFIFREARAGEISIYSNLTGLDFVKQDDYFTFEALANAPDYCTAGNMYLGEIVIKTYEGRPWEIMKQNDLVYNFNTGFVVPKLSIAQLIDVSAGSSYYVSNGLILPGSVTDDGSRVTDYSATYLFDLMKYKYSEVTFV